MPECAEPLQTLKKEKKEEFGSFLKVMVMKFEVWLMFIWTNGPPGSLPPVVVRRNCKQSPILMFVFISNLFEAFPHFKCFFSALLVYI